MSRESVGAPLTSGLHTRGRDAILLRRFFVGWGLLLTGERWSSMLMAAAGMAAGIGVVVVWHPAFGWALAVGSLGAVAAFFVPQRSWILGVLLLVAVTRGTTYGLAGAESTDLLYARGSGFLGIPAIELALIGFAAAQAFRRVPVEWRGNSLGLLLGVLLSLYALHVAAAWASGSSLAEALVGTGGRLLLVVAAMYWITAAAFRTSQQLELVTRFLVLTGAALSAFGLMRYLIAGGDPANPYYSLQSEAQTRLTYFEATNAVFLACAFYGLLFGRPRHAARGGRMSRAMTYAVGILSGLTILLSFRRTNWLGLLLGIGLVASAERRKWMAGITLGGAVILTVALLLPTRTPVMLSTGLAEFGAWDSPVRLQEFSLALEGILQDPLGKGPLGQYRGIPGPGWPAPPTIVHNSFLWLGLKLGLPGALLLIVLTVKALLVIRRGQRRQGDPVVSRLSLLLLGLGGLWIANLGLGTPLLETRLAVLFGVWLGLVACVDRLEVGSSGAESEFRPVAVREP